jgi:hypothetical protein
MEPIAEDIVERAEDFFFKLDEHQVIEQMTEFQKRQPWIVFYIATINELEKSKEGNILFSRFALMIDYCYRSYPIILSVIEKETVSDCLNKESILSRFVPTADGIMVDNDASYLLINQIHLTAIIKAKDSIYEDDSEQTDTTVFDRIWMALITVLHLYQNEAKKQMSKLNLS